MKKLIDFLFRSQDDGRRLLGPLSKEHAALLVEASKRSGVDPVALNEAVMREWLAKH